MIIAFVPGTQQAECKSVEMHHEILPEAGPGDNVGFNVKGIDTKAVKRGHVASDAKNKTACEVSDFLAQVIILNHPNQICAGYTPVLDCHTAHIACKFAELKQKIDKRSGKVTEELPKFVKNGEAAMIQLIPTKPMCVETYKEYAPLFWAKASARPGITSTVPTILQRGSSAKALAWAAAMPPVPRIMSLTLSCLLSGMFKPFRIRSSYRRHRLL